MRSALFVPGNHSHRIDKALASTADAVILDLEDSVAITEKLAARRSAGAILRRPGRTAKYARLNAFNTEHCYGDLIALVCPALDGIVVPKVESAHELRTLDWLLNQLEREQGMLAGGVELMPLIETARSIQALEEICMASPRIRRLAFGAGDYSLDLNLGSSDDEAEFHFARARIVHCSRAAGLEAPIDGVVLQVRDDGCFVASARRARQLGFQGKLCIHPSQVDLANQIFKPSDEETAQARKMVAAFEDAESKGIASIQVDGVFVDYPIASRARRLIAMATDTATDEWSKSHP